MKIISPSLFRNLIFVTLIATLGACANQQPIPYIQDSIAYQKRLSHLNKWEIKGKIAIQNKNGSHSASFSWKQNDDELDIFISGPLGAGTTHITGNPDRISISNSEQQTSTTENPERLLMKYLGWSMPLETLPQWVIGLNQDNTLEASYSNNLLSTLSSDNWNIYYHSYQVVDDWQLPKKITLSNNDNKITLLAKQWSLSTQ